MKKLESDEKSKSVPIEGGSVTQDIGFDLSEKMSSYLQKLNRCLNSGKVVEPSYGVDWNELYGFSSSQ
jgi:hypothetical protein